MDGDHCPIADCPLICVVGPTAVGKTALAVALAQRLDGEVINADSRQVYRGMTIGTAKPTDAELVSVPHHLFDILDPSESFGVALFMDLAGKALGEIRERSRCPIVCGGTGQYIWGLVEGQIVPPAPPDPQFRLKLEGEAEAFGAGELHRQLAAIDPARAAALDARNVRRVIRALEIYHITGRLPSEFLAARSAAAGNSLVLGLTMPRDLLYRRIDERVDRMMREGFLAEVKALVDAGYEMGEGPLASPGYRELGRFLAGELSLQEAVSRTKTQTHRLARRQYTWFKPSDSRIQWLDASEPGLPDKAAALVVSFLESQPPVIQ